MPTHYTACALCQQHNRGNRRVLVAVPFFFLHFHPDRNRKTRVKLLYVLFSCCREKEKIAATTRRKQSLSFKSVYVSVVALCFLLFVVVSVSYSLSRFYFSLLAVQPKKLLNNSPLNLKQVIKRSSSSCNGGIS